jgi:hypothetical protein
VDLSTITTMHIENDDSFLKAKRRDELTIERVLSSGYVLRLDVKDGKPHYTAHDGNGRESVTFYARLYPNDRCFICICDDKLQQCFSVEIPCEDVKNSSQP